MNGGGPKHGRERELARRSVWVRGWDGSTQWNTTSATDMVSASIA